MKRTLILTLSLATFAASATVVFWGDGFGNIGFGLEAHPSGGESVAFGDYAGSLSQDIWRSAFLGAYAGERARDIGSSVYLGDEAGRKSSLHDGVVAIGDGALSWSKGATNVVAVGSNACAGWCNLRNTTWINGQLYISEEDGIFITDSPARQFADAPAFYTNGTWTIQGNIVVRGGMWREEPGTGAVVDPLGSWSGDYDYYIDCRRGGDGNSGRLGHPFASITGAVARISADIEGGTFTNGIPTVAVMRGSYEYPGTLPTNAFRFVAISGRGETSIEPQSAESCRRMSMPNSDDVSELTEFRGFTFRGFDSDTSYSRASSRNEWWMRSPFFLLAFSDCVFEEATYSAESGDDLYRQVFLFCVLDGCEVRPTVRVVGEGSGWLGNSGINELFRGSEFYSCIICMGTNTIAAHTYSPAFASQCYFENCYVDVPVAGEYYVFRSSSGATVTGHSKGFKNSTIRIAAYRGTGSGSAGLSGENSIFSVADRQSATTTSLYPAYGEIEYGDDLRPKDYSKRFFGYGSGNDRGLRNAILTDVAAALADEGYPSNVVVRLLARRQPAAAAEPPSRPTRTETPFMPSTEGVDPEYEE